MSVLDLCQQILDKFGRGGVVKFCDAIGWETWEVCDSCEFESPVTDEPDSATACLVCGSVV